MIYKEFLNQSAEHLQEGVQRISKCLSQLTQEEIWHDHNNNLVSVGNLILHLQGNVSQYIIKGLGNQEYHRHRDGEFTEKPNYSAEELLHQITETVNRCVEIIQNSTEQNLVREITIQGFQHTGTSILLHVVEHFSYHVGQITFAVKFLRSKDLGYYAGHDLNEQ